MSACLEQLAFAKSNATVLGVDIDPSKSASIVAGRSYIKHISSDDVAAAIEKNKLDEPMILQN